MKHIDTERFFMNDKNNIISFVIRTKNEGKYLEKTCKRIREQNEELECEIVIVDSGSSDNTLNIAKKYADKTINISTRSFTWGYALNAGIASTRGDIVCLISGHCFIDGGTDSVKKVYNILRNSDYACLYGMQVGNVCVDKMEAVELSELFPDNKIDSTQVEQIPGVSNACCILKKEVWEKYKFNETAQSAEDGIWYRKITENGYKALYYPDFKVIHAHPFNVEYMYKKWYWRIYKSEVIQGRNKDWKKFNYPRFCLAYLRGMTEKVYKFRKQAKKINICVTLKTCRKYFKIREYAAFRAKCDLKRGINSTIKYDDLAIPARISKIKKSIKQGEFYEL